MDTPESQVPDDRDGLLQALVELANDLGIEVSITLQIGAALVTGTLTGRKDYHKAFSDRFISGFPSESQTVFESNGAQRRTHPPTICPRELITFTCATLG